MLTRPQRRYIPEPRCHGCWHDETRVRRPWTSGHAFRNREPAGTEDQCAKGRSPCEKLVCTLGRVPGDVHELTRLASAFAVPSFSSAKQRAQPTLKARRSFNR